MSNSLQDRFKKIKESNIKNIEKESNKLLPKSEISKCLLVKRFKNLSLEKEEEEYLNNQAIKLLTIQVNSVLELGKIFEEVFEKIGNKGNGVYVSWLEYNGWNKMTALRHRNRWNLFNVITDKNSKVKIATLSQKKIDYIIKLGEKEIEKINNNGIIYLNELLESNSLLPSNSEEIINEDYSFKFEEIDNIFRSLSSKLDNLEESKKIKIEKALKFIKEIMEESL